MTKNTQYQKFVNGEIIDADEVNQVVVDSGNVEVEYPYNNDGTVNTSGNIDRGTADYPFGNAYQRADKTLYAIDNDTKTVTASKTWGDLLSSAGGGGGGGLESLALKNALEKQGNDYPIPNGKYITEAFTSSTKTLCYLRASYSSGTTIELDHGLDSELETINDMETAGDFTAGTSSPTVAANTTNYLEGTQSVKFTATNLASTSADMYETVSLSLTDRNFRTSVRPDTLSNVSEIYIVLYTSSGNQRKFSFDPTDLTAEVWNTLTCDLNLEDGVTSGGVTITDTGTFVRGSITRIYYGITTSSTQTVVPSFDLSRAISDKPLLVPDYGLSLYIEDATNQERFTLTAEDLTDYTTWGSYTLANALSNSYTNDETATYISNTTYNIENNQGIIKSTASGDGAKTAHHIRTLYLGKTVSSGSLEIFHRIYDDAYACSDLSNYATGEIKITVSSDFSGRFKDDQPIILFKKLRGGHLNQSMEGSSTINFWILKQSADGTYSDPEVTITFDSYLDLSTGSYTSGVPSIGSDNTGYYVIPWSEFISYSAGAKTASTFTQATPTEFLTGTSYNLEVFSDDFNRSNGAVGNDWTTTDESISGTGNYGWDIVSNKIETYCVNESGALSVSNIKRNIENYREYPVEYRFNIEYADFNNVGNRFYVFHNNTGSSDTGIGIFINPSSGGGGGSNLIYIRRNSTNLVSFTYAIAEGTRHEIKMHIYKSHIKVKMWVYGTAEPQTWNKEYDYVPLDSTGDYVMIRGWLNSTTTTASFKGRVRIDDFAINNLFSGYTLKYKIENLTSVDKVEVDQAITRQETTVQNPIDYESGSLLSGT